MGPSRLSEDCPMTLFSDVERTNSTPAKYGEDLYSFLDRVASPFFANVRELIEGWYAGLPPEMQPDIRSRFRSGNKGQTFGAFWEMYLHEVLTRAGFQLIPHPEIQGTTKRPDFLVTASDSRSFYLEATTVGPLDDAAERRFDRVLDAVNTVKSNNFRLEVNAEFIGPRAFPAKKKSRELARWLDGLDPNEVTEAYKHGGLFSLPLHVWNQDDWIIEFRPITMKPEARGNPAHRIVLMLTYGPGAIIDDRAAIQSALEVKAKRYGKLDLPLVIALLVYDRMMMDWEDFEAALFGASDLGGRPLASGMPPGLWQTSAGPRYRRVSAVLLAPNLNMWRVAKETPVLWHNPWVNIPLDIPLPWPSIRLDHGTRNLEQIDDGTPPHIFFGIPDDWPGRRYGLTPSSPSLRFLDS
jgi:hypothetical protein